jgi:uncharacterized membrane protein
MNDPLHIGDRLTEGFDAFMNNAMEMILGLLIAGVISIFSCGICGPAMVVGYNKMHLRIARGEKVEATDVLQGFDQFVPALIAGIIIGVAAFIGALFIVGWILVIFLAYWTLMEIADGNDDPIDALKKSFEYNTQNIGPAIIFMIVVAVVSSAGSLVVFGTLVTAPIAISAQAHAWKAVKEAQAEDVGETLPQPLPDDPTEA